MCVHCAQIEGRESGTGSADATTVGVGLDWTGLDWSLELESGPGGWSLEDDVCRVSMMRETERRTPTHKQRNALTTHTHSHSHRSHFTLHSRSQSDENEIEKNGRSRLRL